MNKLVRTAKGLGGTIVILAAWCTTCAQESMPDNQGRCSWCDKPIITPSRYGDKIA
jgi:hypothetical protein